MKYGGGECMKSNLKHRFPGTGAGPSYLEALRVAHECLA